MPQKTSDNRPVYVQDKYAGENGEYSFVRPSITDEEDLEDLLAWLGMLENKIKRSVQSKAFGIDAAKATP